ncbi:hypothetical protein BS50DRAFT_675746 [Corynespora cassiicola Philippines]|uniref:Rhodopsin domain-containing protein n=1 Tax=Corynespora cassiicola Philippines TaxID=1448308 RepID=A0A2T2NQH9_CORCC|nr:hypothetical protein BS50DRAFT_675746 [Corynespora cassiicola Philippines]
MAQPSEPPLRPKIYSTGISEIAVTLIVLTTLFSGLSIILALIRFYARGRKGLGADDYVLMVVVVFLILQMVGGFLLAFVGGQGWGVQDLALHPEKKTPLPIIRYWMILCYTVLVVMIKTSILLSYLRIFGHIRRTQIHIYILLALSWGWGIGVFFASVFQCTPVEKAWKQTMPGHCIKFIPYLWGNSISNFIIDWLILAVPIAPVLKLQLPRTQKILVILAFLCGALTCIASTIRSAATAQFNPGDLVGEAYSALWTRLEPPLATISACLPFLARIFSRGVVRGIRHITNRAGTNKSSQQSGDSNVRGGPKSHYKTLSGTELPTVSTNSRNDIHKTTTTTVNSHHDDKGDCELGLLSTTVTAPRQTAQLV